MYAAAKGRSYIWKSTLLSRELISQPLDADNDIRGANLVRVSQYQKEYSLYYCTLVCKT